VSFVTVTKPGMGEDTRRSRGMYGLACWNGLSAAQQQRLIEWGNLPFGYEPEGRCLNGAEVEITTQWDKAPGPRFYCLQCAIGYLQERLDQAPEIR
jgi:hypothetical protein